MWTSKIKRDYSKRAISSGGYDGSDLQRYLYITLGSINPPQHFNAHYQATQWQKIDTHPKWEGQPTLLVTSNLDLRHETGDFGSNSILEILQLQCMMMIRYNIYIRVLDNSLFTIARYRWHHHIAESIACHSGR